MTELVLRYPVLFSSDPKSSAERDPGLVGGTLILGAIALVLIAGVVLIVLALR